jgi:hypothetical protein
MSGRFFTLHLTLLIAAAAVFYCCVEKEEKLLHDPIYTNIDTEHADVTQEQHSDKTQLTGRNVTLRNKITKKMLTYHKGIFSLTPTFSLFIQKHPVKPNEQLTTAVENNILTLSYTYDFIGHKKGGKVIEFELPSNIDTFDITFSWHKEPRVILANAKAISVKELL